MYTYTYMYMCICVYVYVLRDKVRFVNDRYYGTSKLSKCFIVNYSNYPQNSPDSLMLSPVPTQADRQADIFRTIAALVLISIECNKNVLPWFKAIF